MYYTTATPWALVLAAALFTACEPKPGEPPKPKSSDSSVSSTTVAAANIPPGIVSDPSVPPASQVMNEAPSGAAHETEAARPTGEPRKEEAAFESLVQKLSNESASPG